MTYGACGVSKLASCLLIADFSSRAPSFGTPHVSKRWRSRRRAVGAGSGASSSQAASRCGRSSRCRHALCSAPAPEREDRPPRCALARAATGEGEAARVLDPADRNPRAARPDAAVQGVRRGPARLGAAPARLPARPRNWGKTTTAGTTTSTDNTARFASYHPAGATQRRAPRLQAFVVAISSAGPSTNTTPPEFANLRANRQLERKSVTRDERRHEGAGPGLERLSYALREDRVQRGAEQPRATQLAEVMRFAHRPAAPATGRRPGPATR